MATAQINPQVVKIYKDYVELTLNTGLKKTITIEDFKHALDKSLNIQVKLENNIMPSNCYLFGKGIDSAIFGCYYVGEKREISFVSDRASGKIDKYTIPFPNVVITHKLSKANAKWSMSTAKFYATTKNVGQLPLEPIEVVDRVNCIWPLPLPNMYADGKMCYGGNTMPAGFPENNFRALDWYFKVLFSSPFNNDLHVPELHTTGEEWIKKLSKLSVFPYESLPEYRKAAANVLETADRTRMTTVGQGSATETVTAYGM